MTKRNRVNIRNLWAIVAAVAMLSATVVQAAAVIYEPFADSDATLTDNTPGTGLTNTWAVTASTWTVESSSLFFGPLAVTGNRATKSAAGAGGNFITTGTVDDNSLKAAGLLNPGATLWFSFLWKTPDIYDGNARSGFAFGTSYIRGVNNLDLGAAGSAFGVSEDKNGFYATKWGPVYYSPSAAVSWGERTSPKLIVGKITWATDVESYTNDTIEIYTPGIDLEQPASPVCSNSAAFDQSLFNTIAFVSKAEGYPQIDEIRFGANYADVVPVETNAPSLISIVDDQGGGPIYEDVEIVTYTLTFDKHMDLTTITAADFDNAGTATATIGTVTQPSPAVIRVQLLPTTLGTLQLRIPATSVIKSLAQVDLDTASDILDDTTITINSGVTPVAGTLYWDGPTTSGVTDGASQGGTATWNTTTTNWDMGFGYAGPFAWNNSASLSAVFGGTAGTVTLGENITLSNLTFTSTGDYTIQGNSLSFAAGGLIHHNAEDRNHTFSCGISGSPDVRIRSGTHNPYNQITLSPGSVAQALGVIVSPYSVGSGDKARVTLSGSATANTIEGITYEGAGMHYGVVEVLGSGMWTVGSITNGIVDIQSGTLICNGTMDLRYSGLNPILSGARLGGNFRYIKTDSRSGWLRVNSGGVVAPGDPAISNGVGTITIQHGPYSFPSVNSFYDGSIYEWEIGASTNDTIHIVYNDSTRTLDLDNFVLKIFDAGGSPSFADQLPVFTYDIGVTIDTNGFPNTSSNFDMSEVPQWGDPADLSLVDNGTGIIYLTGLAKPPAGTVLILR